MTESKVITTGMAIRSQTDIAPDWTWNAEGVSNSSPQFIHLCNEVERLIRDDAHALLSGRADLTARLIMAQLAHKHGLSPQEPQ